MNKLRGVKLVKPQGAPTKHPTVLEITEVRCAKPDKFDNSVADTLRKMGFNGIADDNSAKEIVVKVPTVGPLFLISHDVPVGKNFGRFDMVKVQHGEAAVTIEEGSTSYVVESKNNTFSIGCRGGEIADWEVTCKIIPDLMARIEQVAPFVKPTKDGWPDPAKLTKKSKPDVARLPDNLELGARVQATACGLCRVDIADVANPQRISAGNILSARLVITLVLHDKFLQAERVILPLVGLPSEPPNLMKSFLDSARKKFENTENVIFSKIVDGVYRDAQHLAPPPST